MPAINLFADFHFIAMDKSMENEGFPSKVYSIMASGRPLVVVSSEQTPIINFLKGNPYGFACYRSFSVKF